MLSLGDADCILVSFWSGLSVYRVLVDGGNKSDAPVIPVFLRRHNLLGPLNHGAVNWQDLVNDAQENIKSRLDGVAAVDGDIALQDFLQHLTNAPRSRILSRFLPASPRCQRSDSRALRPPELPRASCRCLPPARGGALTARLAVPTRPGTCAAPARCAGFPGIRDPGE